MSTAQLCIVRHGETDWNKSGILQGWLDVPINAQGRSQAAGMARTFANQGFEAIWCSTLVRASETAQILSSALQLSPPRSHDGLKERNFGAIQGIPKNELAELNPAQLEQILRRNPAAQFVGGESMDEFADRVLQALADIGDQHPKQKVLVISHGWVLDVITRHIGGLPRDAVLPFKPGNGHSLWVDVEASQIRAAAPHVP
jgi:probable phosphoglycerate mutase